MFVINRSAQISQQSRSHLKILSPRSGTGSKFHTEDPQNLVAGQPRAWNWCTPECSTITHSI